jgi:phage terminase small subunit
MVPNPERAIMTDPKPAKQKGRAKTCGTAPRLGTKLTAKEERYCLRFIETGHKCPSYRWAFGCDHPDERVVWRKVERIMSYPRVQKRIQELKDRIMAKHDVTIESLIKELEEARKAALCAETVQSAAAVSATMGKAKLAGLDKQKVELTGADGAPLMPSRIELVAPSVNGKG